MKMPRKKIHFKYFCNFSYFDNQLTVVKTNTLRRKGVSSSLEEKNVMSDYVISKMISGVSKHPFCSMKYFVYMGYH